MWEIIILVKCNNHHIMSFWIQQGKVFSALQMGFRSFYGPLIPSVSHLHMLLSYLSLP